jgi:hypothetical protein
VVVKLCRKAPQSPVLSHPRSRSRNTDSGADLVGTQIFIVEHREKSLIVGIETCHCVSYQQRTLGGDQSGQCVGACSFVRRLPFQSSKRGFLSRCRSNPVKADIARGLKDETGQCILILDPVCADGFYDYAQSLLGNVFSGGGVTQASRGVKLQASREAEREIVFRHLELRAYRFATEAFFDWRRRETSIQNPTGYLMGPLK